MRVIDDTGEPPRKQLKMSAPPSPAASSSSAASSQHPFSALAQSPNGSRISLESALKTKKSGPSYGMEGLKASTPSSLSGGKAPKKLILKSSRGQHHHRFRSAFNVTIAKYSRSAILPSDTAYLAHTQRGQMVFHPLKTLSMLRFRLLFGQSELFSPLRRNQHLNRYKHSIRFVKALLEPAMLQIQEVRRSHRLFTTVSRLR